MMWEQLPSFKCGKDEGDGCGIEEDQDHELNTISNLGEEVEVVECCRYLGVHLTTDWTGP